MRITNIRLQNIDGFTRASADITWEQANKPPLNFFVEAPEQYARGLWADPNAILLAVYLAAWHAGEQRIEIDQPVCPVLFQHLKVVIPVLKTWYQDIPHPAPVIEPVAGFNAYHFDAKESLGLLSCGIDSLGTVRWNQLHIPKDHPLSISAGMTIGYHNHTASGPRRAEQIINGRLKTAATVAADAGIELIPVLTNIKFLDRDGWFYTYKSLGSLRSAVACFFSKRFHSTYIATNHTPVSIYPWGSHPLLDQYYSTSYFRVIHHGVDLTRFEKVALVADWQTGLDNIRVCQNDDDGVYNCCTCEKCILTMCELEALGKLKDSAAFAVKELTPELLETIRTYDMLYNDFQIDFYEEIMPALAARGRADLVNVLQDVLAGYKQRKLKIA
jgi:hypothetical protein